ncbi:MAG TPA: class I SAM-dependent methyltransferase [Ktedonobacterales bacterium]|nr:class I SAM-dependent methyltransferase [Ktedonobacterales bacterium]
MNIDAADLNREVQAIWNANATFWDDAYGEGNQFQRALLGPALERLLALQPEERVLEVACGNGTFARRMATLGASVVATDFSEVFLEHARVRTTKLTDRIEYRLLDATQEEQLLALGERDFDAVVCNMALMDMSTIDPLMRCVVRLLKPGGRFVFSVSHPCFHNTSTTLLAEQSEADGVITRTYSVRVARYLHLTPAKGIGIIGQPQAHYYFDRPLHALLGAGFRAGLALDGLEEPAFDGTEPAANAFSWANFTEIPPTLVARFRLPGN